MSVCILLILGIIVCLSVVMGGVCCVSLGWVLLILWMGGWVKLFLIGCRGLCWSVSGCMWLILVIMFCVVFI